MVSQRILLFSSLVLSQFFMATLRLAAAGCQVCSQRSFSVRDGVPGWALLNAKTFDETVVDNHPECFWKCADNCRCLSFNVCERKCQLNIADELSSPNSLKVKKGCVYYDLPKLTHEATCTPSICCQKSNPCFNGGSCSSPNATDHRRFACKCLPGFYGDRCDVWKPEACRDYWIGAAKPVSGEYVLVDKSGTPYEVVCDFDSEDDVAWTLVQSFSLNNTELMDGYPFMLDHPMNEGDLNWNLYRLSKARISSIRANSTSWRATCGYPTHGIDFTDYLVVHMSAFDPMVSLTIRLSPCKTVEYMNYRGIDCHGCTVAVYQYVDYRNVAESLHVSPHWGFYYGCTFNATSIVKKTCWKMFGYYGKDCVDPKFRCTESLSSTSQIWFGGSKPSTD